MNQEEATRVVNSLFESMAPFLMRYALRYTRSAETAEDLVQEAFMALYRDLRNGKHIEDPRAWTVGAVRNQMRKAARFSRTHSEDLLAPEAFDMMPAQPWVLAESSADSDLGPETLQVLSRREEEVVLLRLQSMKYREIGQELGISSKSVCTLLARAVKKLQLFSQTRESGEGRRVFCEREIPNALQ